MKYKLKDIYRADPRALLALDALREASREELTALLALALSTDGDIPEEHMPALSFWRGAGVAVAADTASIPAAPAKATDEPAPRTPVRQANRLAELSTAELGAIIEKSDFSSLVDSVTQLLGRLLNSSEINILAGLVSELDLSTTYILALVSFCVEEGKRSLRYVEGCAFGLHGDGIHTEEALVEYIARRRRFATTEWNLRKLYGIGQRALSKTEAACFYRWSAEWGFDIETIGLAYDITVDSVKKADVRYTDKILAGWHERGVTSVADAEALIAAERDERAAERMKSAAAAAAARPSRRRSAPPSPALSSFDTDEMFERALKRSYSDKKDD